MLPFKDRITGCKYRNLGWKMGGITVSWERFFRAKIKIYKLFKWRRWKKANSYSKTQCSFTKYRMVILPAGRLIRCFCNTLIMICKHALVDFRTMLLEVSRPPAMLQFLNNQQNRKGKPNENFARELMEIFTLRKNYKNSSQDSEEEIWIPVQPKNWLIKSK